MTRTADPNREPPVMLSISRKLRDALKVFAAQQGRQMREIAEEAIRKEIGAVEALKGEKK